MTRLYTVRFRNVTISAAQDLFGLLATANMAIALKWIELSQKTLAGVELKDFVVRRNAATVTAGSGGNSATPTPELPTDSAATFTARVNDTTPQSSSGTVEEWHGEDWNFINNYFFAWPGSGLIAKPNQGISVFLGTAPSAPMVASGTIGVEERF